MQVRAIILRLMEEVANAYGPFKGKGSIEGTPGKREGAGAAIFRFFAASGVTGAGKLAFEGTRVYPVLGVCYESKVSSCF
jgi:hypothetical protein